MPMIQCRYSAVTEHEYCAKFVWKEESLKMRKKLATMLLATVLFMSITLPFAKAEIGPHDHIPYVITDVPYTYIVGSPMVCQETQYYNLTVCAL